MLRSVGPTLLAGLVLAGWSVFLLDTVYLEPLPSTAGKLGVALLLVTAVGAGLVSGLRWWTLLLLPAAFVGFFDLSASLHDSGVEYKPYNTPVLKYLWLIPAVVGLGAVASRFIPLGARIAGAALLLLPLAVFTWAAYRHVRPIDHRPAHPLLIQHPALPESPSYRGVHIGDSKRRLLALLGHPDHAVPGSYVSDAWFDYAYGNDTIRYATTELTGATKRHDLVTAITVRDARAQTPEGVGIGDSLALVQKRFADASCFVPLHGFDPGCQTNDTYEGASGYAYLWFQGDPIEEIVIEGVPPP